MSRHMIIEEVRDGGNVEVARIQSGEVIIGREPDLGIKLGAQAVSRDHGAFLRVRNHWFYRDLGSTNGSWLNGVQLAANQWRIVRSGDYLQLADVALKIRSENEQGQPGITDFQSLGGRSLIVFSDGQFADEFPVPEFGRALVIGGAEGDIDLPGDVYDLPALVVERRGSDICTFSVAKQLPVIVNGERIEETTKLGDGDNIQVSGFTVLVNDPSSAKRMKSRGGTSSSGEGRIGHVREWGAEDAGPDLAAGIREESNAYQAGTGSFGTASADNPWGSTETMAINPDELEITGTRSDMHPSMRHMAEESNSYTFSSVEDKVIILIGLMLMMLLVVLVVWWVFI